MNDRARRALLPLRFAAVSLWRRRGQFALLFLTLVTAFWAAFGIAGVMSGTERQVRRDLERLGWDVINVHPPLDPLGFLGHGLTAGGCDRLAALVSGTAAPADIAPGLVRMAGGEDGSPGEAVLLIGTTPAWAEVLGLEYLSGRFFLGGEEDACALDEWVYRRLFPGGGPGGLRGDATIDVQVAGRWRTLRVAGVVRDPIRIRERFEEWDTVGISRNYLVRFMEYQSVYIPRPLLSTGDGILAAVVRAGEGVDPRDGALRIREDLRRRGSTAVAWSRREWAERVLDAADRISVMSNFVWIVVLLVTAFMVSTVVFIIVRGRFVEISIRRVEGAGRLQIAGQLIAENLLLTVLAAGLGLVIAQAVSSPIERSLLGWPADVSAGDVLLVGPAGTAIVVLTTMFPALRAAALDPVRVLSGR
jgi:hypothetical protein